MTGPFHRGEKLIIHPADGDDPLALHHSGTECVFARYVETPLFTYASVQFPDRDRVTHFRLRDLERGILD